MTRSQQISNLAIEVTGGLEPAGFQNKFYIKGKNRGKQKPYWNIDDRKFEKFWKSILPYVHKSAARSMYYAKDSLEKEDIIEEIRILFFKVFYNFGPRPNNKPFSYQLGCTVNNVLTNMFNISKRDSTQIHYESISIFHSLSDDLTIGDTIVAEGDTFAMVDVFADLTKEQIAIVKDYLQSENITEVCEDHQISRSAFKNLLASCVLA